LNPEANKEKSSSTEGEKKIKNSEKSRLIVSVRDINCVTCGLAIEKQVKKLMGVEDVRTAVMLNKVFIDYDPKIVDPATIRKALDRTGYKGYMSVEEKKQ
jgi:copper chaperone CopZ